MEHRRLLSTIATNGVVAASIGVFGVFMLGGCSTADVIGAHVLKNLLKPKPTIVQATVKVAADANPDARDRPSPIKVKFYLLRSANVLNASDFYDLKEHDRELLVDDLRLFEEQVFKPGAEEVPVEFKVPAEETSEDERMFLGVVAGYWNVDEAIWRVVQEIPVRDTTVVNIDIARTGVTIADVE